MIATTLGHYRVLRLLGKGGMGEVYAALDTKLGRSVALKILPPALAGDPARRDRFQREARAVATLNHPSIVTLHSVEEAEGLLFLTMELIEGRPLSELIRPPGMELGPFLQLAVPLADAVSTAHGRGIVHRDLKPANIMVTPEGRPKVLDFGLAKLKQAEPGAEGISMLPTRELTGEGRIVGTIAYTSPEQAEGKPVDARSDVFALGIVLYEMLTGRRPFQGDSAVGVLSAILKDTPVGVTDLRPDLPSELGRIIRRCLEKDPARRMQTALDLRNELEDLRNDSSSGPALRSMPTKAQSARELVERYKATRDATHLGALFDRYSPLALGVSLRYLRNRQDAEDAVMEVYEHLMTALLKHEVANFESWLYSVVTNHCRMTLRRRQAQPTAIDASDELLEALLPQVAAPPEGDETERQRQALPAALARLGEGQRRCLDLFYLQGHSYAEVARRSGFTLNEVKSYLQNGKRNLKALLGARPG